MSALLEATRAQNRGYQRDHLSLSLSELERNGSGAIAL